MMRIIIIKKIKDFNFHYTPKHILI
jgi:hypothetical protein